MTLIDWQRHGWLTPHQTSRQEITALLAIVERDLGDSSSRVTPLRPQFPSHHSRAFWNIRSHGDTGSSRRHLGGIQFHCHFRKVRSGCGIIARWRPSGEHRPAMPAGDPLGLNG